MFMSCQALNCYTIYINMDQTDTPTTSSGSRAADFQPETQNPQNNVGGGLQTGGGGLQPVAPSNGSNVFDQPGINPQAFPQTSSLQVIDTTSPGLATGITEAHPDPLFWILVPLVMLASFAWLYFTRRRQFAIKPAAVDSPATAPKPAKIKSKKQSKAKNKKHRKKK